MTHRSTPSPAAQIISACTSTSIPRALVYWKRLGGSILKDCKEFKTETQDIKDVWIPLVPFTHWMTMIQVKSLFTIDYGSMLSMNLELAGRVFLSTPKKTQSGRSTQLRLRTEGPWADHVYVCSCSKFQDAYNIQDETGERMYSNALGTRRFTPVFPSRARNWPTASKKDEADEWPMVFLGATQKNIRTSTNGLEVPITTSQRCQGTES